MRAPTPIELTCADPEAPCKLPNQFLADPPLQKVVSKTFEAGARGNLGVASTWSAAVYRTELYDDIQFIASGGAANAGYFQNVGQTRRQGVELGASTRVGDWSFDFRYSRVNATYRSTFVAFSPSNSSANEDGAIVVQPGDRIPGIPRDSVKLRVEFEPVERFAIGLNMLYASSQYALGDENNQDRNGPLPSYTVFNLDARYDVTPALRVVVNVANLFDRTLSDRRARRRELLHRAQQHVRPRARHPAGVRAVPRARGAARHLGRDPLRFRPPAAGDLTFAANPRKSNLELRRHFRFSTRRWGRDPARHATHQSVDSLPILEASQVAGDDGAGGRQFGEALAHLRNRNAGLLRELRVESLTVFLEAREDVVQGGHQVEGGQHCTRFPTRPLRPRF